MSTVTQHPATTTDKNGTDSDSKGDATLQPNSGKNDDGAAQKLKGSKRRIAALFAVILCIAGAYWILQRYTHVYTEDARIAADMIDISSTSSGLLVDVAVSTGDSLSSGDIIASIDDRERQLKIQELQENLAAVDAEYATQEAMMQMVEKQTDGALESAKSQKSVSQATLLSMASELEFRSNEWKRAQLLKDKNIISQQGWESAQTQFRKAKQSHQAATSGVATTQAKLVEAQADQTQLKVLESGLLKLKHQRAALALILAQQEVEFKDLTIRAPHDGIVDKIFVDTGEFIQPGRRLLLMHNPLKVWVSANIKETQIRHIKLGQTVEISVDAYPDTIFTGEIIRIGDSATSLYSLLPSTNPSGNFTKVTQRLPIKIAIQQQDNLLKPGMMVGVAINVR
ncbi:MAG: HlyD family secretion protein [Pseudomonadales bacterium]|nr:HlyD family secretion protein [Pseudomonadales bacterium]